MSCAVQCNRDLQCLRVCIGVHGLGESLSVEGGTHTTNHKLTE